MTAELNQENYKEVLDCDIKLTQKLVVDEIKHGFPEELDKYFTSSRLKSNFLTIKENGSKILKNMEDLSAFSGEKVWEVQNQIPLNEALSNPYQYSDIYYVALMKQLGFITDPKSEYYRVGCRDFLFNGGNGLFNVSWRTYTHSSLPKCINFALERNKPKGMRQLFEDTDFYLNNYSAISKTYRFSGNTPKMVVWVLANACISGLGKHKNFYDPNNQYVLENKELAGPLKESQKYRREVEKSPEYKALKKENREFFIIRDTYKKLGLSEKKINDRIGFLQRRALTVREDSSSCYLTADFIKEIAARNNYNYEKSLKELAPHIKLASQQKSIRGGALNAYTPILYCDFDSVNKEFGMQSLRKLMKCLKITPLFIEESLSNGGVHAAFFFDQILTNEDRKNIEKFLNEIKGIHVEISKFFESSIIRVPFCSGDYKPVVVSKNFVDNGVYYRIKADKNYFNTILHNVNPPINKLEKTLRFARLNLKKKGFWHRSEKEYVGYYVNDIINYVRNGDDLTEIRIDKNKLLKDYECGKRWEYQQTDIPIMKYRLGYTLDQCVKSMLERKGTSKDLNGPLGNPRTLTEHIRKYYDQCELFDGQGHRITARIRKDPDQFYSNLDWLPQELKKTILNDSYHRRHFGENMFNLMSELGLGNGSRKYRQPIQKEIFTQFLTYLSLEIFGKVEFESTVRLRRNLNNTMRFLTGVQFPDIYIIRAAKYFCSLLNSQNVHTEDEKIIHFQLEKSFKEYRIEGEERFNYLNNFLERFNVNHIKRLILTYLQFEPLKDGNGFSHIKNHCCSYNLGSFNSRMQLLEIFLQNFKESSRFSLNDSISELTPIILQDQNGTLVPYTLAAEEEILGLESIYDLDPLSDLNKDSTISVVNRTTGEITELQGIILPPIQLHTDLTLSLAPLTVQRYSEEDTKNYFTNFSSTPFQPHFNAREGPPLVQTSTDSAFF